MAAIPSSDTYLSHRMRLLVVEDDPMIGKALVQGLGRAGFVVDLASDGAMAELALLHDVYELVVLDLGLPSKDGMSLLQGLRDKGRQVPVIIATARDAVAQRIEGLNAGADDYLVKPYDPGELLARLRAIERRRGAAGDTPVLHLGKLDIDLARDLVRKDGVPVVLTSKEWALLRVMATRPDRIHTRETLQDALYGFDSETESNTLEVFVSRLRRKLGREHIQTLRGLGYRLAYAPEEAPPAPAE